MSTRQMLTSETCSRTRLTPTVGVLTQPQRKPARIARKPPKRSRAIPPTRAASGQAQPKVVVVGGGWAGFGAAKHLSQQGYAVSLVDAAPNPGGLSAGWRTPQGRAVEAGIKGFWFQYHNIFALVKELGIDWPFTDWETSGFWTPQGLSIEAPVFSSLPRLPTMLGQFVHTFSLFRDLSLADRATMVPLLRSVFDYGSTPETYQRYDKMTAKELFRQYGVSQRLYDGFLRPLLLVGMFAPPEELSAAAMLSTFEFYTLAHQADFDVCWCKGSVAEKIFSPLVEQIKGNGGNIVGGRLVTDVVTDAAGRVTGIKTKQRGGQEQQLDADAVIFAVGINETGGRLPCSGVPA